MDVLTTILILGIAAQGIAGAVLILAGPIYAWNGDPRRRPTEWGAEQGRRTCECDGSTALTKQLLTKRRTNTSNQPPMEIGG